MNVEFITLIILMCMAIGGAIIAISVRTLISSVVSLGTTGMILSIIFLLLKAPDIAITQVVVEILTLIILVRATIGRDTTADMTSSPVFAFFFILIFLSFLVLFIEQHISILPKFGISSISVGKEYLRLSSEKLKVANSVAGVILDFRGYDTLGEATVIFLGIVGVFVLLRKKGRKSE